MKHGVDNYVREKTYGTFLFKPIQVSHLFNDASLGINVDITVVALLLLEQDEVISFTDVLP